MSEYIILSIFLFLGAFIAAAATVVGLLLGYRTRNTKNKMAPYECGMQTIGNARILIKNRVFQIVYNPRGPNNTEYLIFSFF